jgi:hypothetical protein
MKIEYFSYYLISKESKFYPKGDRKYLKIVDVKAQLPEYISKELIYPPKLDDSNLLHIEISKSKVIEYLDKITGIDKHIFGRVRYIEITKEEIDNYDYFFIGLRDLNWGEQIVYEFTPPLCTMSNCPWGAKIISPTKIKLEKVKKNLDIAQIYDIWDYGVRFVLSEKLKTLFELNGITGLTYEPCLVEPRKADKEDSRISETNFFVAEIVVSKAQQAEKIYLQDDYFCKKHSIIFRYDGLCNRVISRKEISHIDFQKIDRVVIKKKEYYLRRPMFIISRKVLNVFLENMISDLRPIGIYLKKNFAPVPFD